MRAVSFREFGAAENLELVELPKPEPGPVDVVVQVSHCGVNPVDASLFSGRWGVLPLPHVPGSEISGTVAEVGEGVSGVSEGDRVAVAFRLFCGMCEYCRRGHEEACVGHRSEMVRAGAPDAVGITSQGGYAKYVKVPAANLLPIPRNVSLESAAAATLDGVTAWHLVERSRLQPGETVLVFGASGGVGSFAVQIAHLNGARVLAVSSGEKVGRVKQLGADVVLDREAEDLQGRISEVTDGDGVDVVLDPLGAKTFPVGMRALKNLGRYATCGVLTGADVQLNLAALYPPQKEVIGSTGGSRADLADILNFLDQGRVTAPVWKTYPLEEVHEAHAALKDPERFGKVLLAP